MSDTEDAQDIKKMTDDGFIYQLRKIGPDASCSKVPQLMRLNLGLTRIGRGQHNDYFLDSAVLKNFISRSHVEINGKKNENGEIEFSMTDKGLNGTFVNDVRTQRTCILEINDKITFGHTNGYKIEPGSYAEQPKSEFQFIFEKIPISCKTTEVCQDINDEDSPESPAVEPKKDSGIDRSFLSDLQSNQHVQNSSKPTKTSQNVRNRKDSDSMSDSDDKIVTNTKSKGSKKSGKSEITTKKSSKKESSRKEKEKPKPRRKSSTGSVSKFSETLPAVDSDDEDDDSKDEEEDADEVDTKEDNKIDTKEDNKNKESEEDSDSKSESEEEEEEEEEEVIPKKKRKLPPRKTAPQSTQRKVPVKGKKTVQPESSSESDSSSDNESSKPEADQRPKQAPASNKQKMTRAALTSKKRPSSGNNSAPAMANKRPRRQQSGAKSSATATSSDLEPGVEWYDEDKCDSSSCKRPKKNRTPWVQCDDCDGWYHTVCVGANYNQLKDSDARFNCGCIS